MKMTPEHYQQLKDAVAQTVKADPGMLGDYRAEGLPPKRFRWDLLWKSGLRAGDSVGNKTSWPVYDYLDDTHIDTALRAIMKELDLAWAAESAPSRSSGATPAARTPAPGQPAHSSLLETLDALVAHAAGDDGLPDEMASGVETLREQLRVPAMLREAPDLLREAADILAGRAPMREPIMDELHGVAQFLDEQVASRQAPGATRGASPSPADNDGPGL